MRLEADDALKVLPRVMRRARQAAGLSVKQAAAVTDYAELTIQNSERPGRPYPALEYFFGLLEAYGLSLGDVEQLMRDERDASVRQRLDSLEKRLTEVEGEEIER